MIRWVCYVLGVCFAISFTSCQNDSGTLGLVYGTGNKIYGLAMVDTTAVRMSTVLLDSMPAAGMTSLLIGKCTDPKLGKIESKGYLQIDLGAAWNPTLDLQYDSMMLVMKYSGYYYGDTTQSQSYEIRQVTEDFTTYNLSPFWADQLKFSGLLPAFYQGNSLYNKRELKVDEVSAPLGTFTLKPRPSAKGDSVAVRLDDAVGQAWMAEAQRTDAGAFDFDYNFLRYFFKGLRISSTSVNGPHIIGLSPSSFVIRLYYHGRVNELITGMHRNFSFNSSANYTYNNISSDRSGTLLASLSSNKKEISSVLTNHESYVQSGVGILTKISFPGIKNITGINGFRQINSANLIIEPVPSSYDNHFRLPIALTLISTDNSNLPLNLINQDFTTSSQFATISINSEHGTNSAYVFSVTQYIQSLINSGGPGQTGTALFVSTPLSVSRNSPYTIFNATDRLRISNDLNTKYHTRLEVYYLYENE